MPRFNLELFKPLILNFAYIHSKRRKLGMLKILFQKCQICLSKLSKFATNSPNSFIFNFWLREMSRDHNETLRHKKTSRFTFGERFILFCLLAIDIANHSYAQNTPLLQALDPLSRHKSGEISRNVTLFWNKSATKTAQPHPPSEIAGYFVRALLTERPPPLRLLDLNALYWLSPPPPFLSSSTHEKKNNNARKKRKEKEMVKKWLYVQSKPVVFFSCSHRRPGWPAKCPQGVRCLAGPVPFFHRDAHPKTETQLREKPLHQRHKPRRQSTGEQLWTSSLCLQDQWNQRHCSFRGIRAPYVATLTWLMSLCGCAVSTTMIN